LRSNNLYGDNLKPKNGFNRNTSQSLVNFSNKGSSIDNNSVSNTLQIDNQFTKSDNNFDENVDNQTTVANNNSVLPKIIPRKITGYNDSQLEKPRNSFLKRKIPNNNTKLPTLGHSIDAGLMNNIKEE
jgi:hypothetical protein